MEKTEIVELEDIIPHALKHLLPEIKESVEVCINCFHMDAFNDTWTFGTQLWKNIWNRFNFVIDEYEDCPFEICGKGNEYKFKIGPYVLRHHRINSDSKLPCGAKAVKAAAGQQMYLPGLEWQSPIEKDNIVLAIDADIQNGLKEVFLGELQQADPEEKKYKWGKKVQVYLAEGVEPSSAEFVRISDMPESIQHVPEEEVAEVAVEFGKTQIDKNIEDSASEK